MTTNNLPLLKKNKFALSKREITRLFSIMTLYMMKYEDQSKSQVIADLLKQDLWKNELDEDLKYPSIDEIFLMKLIDGTLEYQSNIHDILRGNIKNKQVTIEKMDRLVLSILEIACFEMLEDNVEKRIICNQYLFLAGCFFEDHEVGLINALLDSVCKSLDSTK